MRRRKDSVSDWEHWEGQGEAEQGRKRTRFLGWEDRHKLITDRTYHWIESNGGSSRRHKKCGWWWSFQNDSPRCPSLMKGAASVWTMKGCSGTLFSAPPGLFAWDAATFQRKWSSLCFAIFTSPCTAVEWHRSPGGIPGSWWPDSFYPSLCDHSKFTDFPFPLDCKSCEGQSNIPFVSVP